MMGRSRRPVQSGHWPLEKRGLAVTKRLEGSCVRPAAVATELPPQAPVQAQARSRSCRCATAALVLQWVIAILQPDQNFITPHPRRRRGLVVPRHLKPVLRGHVVPAQCPPQLGLLDLDAEIRRDAPELERGHELRGHLPDRHIAGGRRRQRIRLRGIHDELHLGGPVGGGGVHGGRHVHLAVARVVAKDVPRQRIEPRAGRGASSEPHLGLGHDVGVVLADLVVPCAPQHLIFGGLQIRRGVQLGHLANHVQHSFRGQEGVVLDAVPDIAMADDLELVVDTVKRLARKDQLRLPGQRPRLQGHRPPGGDLLRGSLLTGMQLEDRVEAELQHLNVPQISIQTLISR
mmetsp:Transcript_109247/g.185483  ORF Transcript_109247/g.185483 Transcript_109247/m.185483 type:complete len:346 (+) Transcript_109247:530-1567(+)